MDTSKNNLQKERNYTKVSSKISKDKKQNLGFKCYIIICFLFLFVSSAIAADRCVDFIPDVRTQHIKYFGYNFPYWYAMGQIKQESNCRTNVTAFDGGMGLTQFMKATADDINKKMGGGYNPYNPDHAIKMQAFYMWELHQKNWDGALWLSYTFYNSGYGTMKKEFQRSGKSEADWLAMKNVCKRRVLQLKSGPLDLCDVGYDYPQKIFKYGKLYKQGVD